MLFPYAIAQQPGRRFFAVAAIIPTGERVGVKPATSRKRLVCSIFAQPRLFFEHEGPSNSARLSLDRNGLGRKTDEPRTAELPPLYQRAHSHSREPPRCEWLFAAWLYSMPCGTALKNKGINPPDRTRNTSET